ncbi:RNA-binding protein 33 [Diachasma alloeum]|uniref:RNA-binding protein 33 n=1 Tax=Diachasma alloeum TaxID=454923 RepID=UPI00073836E0|nr:RNA-binding protein 33 [Diachasma alloeum]
MSDQDDTLLDEDLGDEEYDLGNDEEEALLADDYEIDRQNSYKGEEETDDVLDLGVTDALDDLEGEDDNVEYRNETDSHNQSHYNDERVDNRGNYYDERRCNYDEKNQMNLGLGDLREKLQKRDIGGNGQIVEEDECEEARERRNRFQTERIMISPKMNSDIPDSLESVVTAEQSRPVFRGRGRGRGMMRGIRGGRYPMNVGNYNPRFIPRPSFDEQKPQYRPPLQDNRHFQNGPSNIMNPQMMYPQENQFQQYPRAPRPHFNEPHQFNPNQFQGPPRHQNPPMDFRPRGPMPGGLTPRFNGPMNPGFMPNQHFPRPQHEQDMPGRQMMPPGPMMANMQPGPPMPGSQGPPMHPPHPGMPPGQPEGPMPPFRHPGPSQIPHQAPHPHQSVPMGGQPGFEPRQQFQEPPWEARNMYDGRSAYNNSQPVGQFNPGVVHQQHPVPSVQIPQKILINPHFRGNSQQTSEGRPPWDNPQQPPVVHPHPSEQFRPNPGPYPGQPPFNAPTNQENSQDYQKNYAQNKSDDPYAYFSDVWQENKAKPRSLSPSKSYSGESNYGRDSSYRDYDKYKSDSRDPYPDDQRYRDRSPPPRSRDPPPRSRPPPPSNSYHNDSYDQRSRPPNSSSRPAPRLGQKRTPEPQDRGRDVSPKRMRAHRSPHDTRTEPSDHHKDVQEAEMDPEEREYRKKMEEQKRLREKILQEKENRRKQAALERQGEDSKELKNNDHQQESTSSIATLSKDLSETTVTARPRIRVAAGQATEVEKPVRIVRTVSEKIAPDNQPSKDSVNPREVKKPVPTRRVVIQKQLPNARVATSIQKTVSNLQKAQSNPQSPSAETLTKKGPLQLQKTAAGGGRTVVKERPTTIRKVVVSEVAAGTIKKAPGTVQSNRVVLQKPVQVKRLAEGKSNTILIENLAASTSEAQIRRMCQGIGTLESIIMGEGTATIVFKTHSAAMVFHKKYQRKMIDLSMINVKFLPQNNSQLTTVATT